MKLAVSNIAMPSFDHEDIIRVLAQWGITGLEVAPSKVWEDIFSITHAQVDIYRRQVERAGMKVVGIHSLFYDQPCLGLFKSGELHERTLDFLVHLSRICADLGGSTIVFGSPQSRKRGDLSVKEADARSVDFFKELCNRIQNHGTFILLEALGRNEADYIHSLEHVCRITEQVDAPCMGYHLDAKAAMEANDINVEVMRRIETMLVHVHVNELDLGVLGSCRCVGRRG